jgi:hypothetical protein
VVARAGICYGKAQLPYRHSGLPYLAGRRLCAGGGDRHDGSLPVHRAAHTVANAYGYGNGYRYPNSYCDGHSYAYGYGAANAYRDSYSHS